MLNKAQGKSEIPLHNIARSIDALMGSDWIKRHYNPLDPEFIIRAWVAGTHEMQLSAKGFLGLYALLDSQLLLKLNSLYENIGKYIEGLASSDSNGSRTAAVNTTASSEGDDFEAMFGDIDDIQPDSDAGYKHQETAPTSQQSSQVVSTKEIIRKLTELQSNRALDDSNYYSSNYLLDLSGLLNGENLLDEGEVSAETIGQINNDILDMSQLMFSFIMDDYNIPDDIRYHISRLQIPYLKLGLLDRTMFQDKEHPGRLLLMELSQSIDTWDPGHSSGIDQLLGEIIHIVDDIIETFDDDVAIFALIHRAFKAFLMGDSHVDEGMKERQKNRDSHFHRTDNARLLVEGTLADLCVDKRIPPIVEKILDEYWSKVLFIEYLKEGDQSQEYKELIETATILIDSVQPKFTEEDRKAMAKVLPAIIKRLKSGLNLISIASFESVDLFRELQQCHMEVLKERSESLDIQSEEVSEDAYRAFKAQHKHNQIPWDRSAIEASMLEENIERSIAMTSTDPVYEDDNPNVIRQSKGSQVHDSTLTRADREREIIDNELKEARDAYEKAIQDHQQKKVAKNTDSDSNDNDDFMSMFFQDPNFAEKQATALRDGAAPSEQSTSDSAGDMEDYANDMDFDSLGDDEHETIDKQVSDTERAFFADQMERESVKELVPEITETETIEEIGHYFSKDAEKFESTATVKPDADTSSEIADGNKIENPAIGRAHGANVTKPAALLDDEVNELIERLKVGLWLDLYHADGQKIRAKIMAIVPSVGKYIFGDRAGKKLVDYNRQGLYTAIKEGRIQLSELDTAYDQTLESVISNLRIMKKAEDD